MPLVLDNLRNAVKALSDLLAVTENKTRMAQFSQVERDGIRAGVIQHFEVTYELCWKLMARWLKTNVGTGVVDGVTRRELFRRSAQQRLIADVDRWMQHHEARNLTSHLYDAKRAEAVYGAIADFVHDARALLKALETRND
jgi:nucleotidyltransferase substrate binding protein (TIGR01987 family)